MQALLLAFLAALLALPAHAIEVGRGVAFQGLALKQGVSLPARQAAGLAWESGASDPVPVDFQALLFQGSTDREGLAFEVSVKDGQDWGPWTRAQVERFANGRFWAKAEVAGRTGDLVRLRAVDQASGAAGSLEFFGLDASGMEDESSGRSGGPSFGPPAFLPAAAQPEPKPDVQSRYAWGAKDATRPYEFMQADRITVHHTESGQPMGRQDAIAELRAIQSFHQRGRHWIDIAYHFVIDGTGQVWEGRPLAMVGAHVKDRNDGNIGIALMGDFQAPKNQRPTDAQFASLVALSRWLSATYHIPADRILGHRDQEPTTTCPGDILYVRLPELRRAVAAAGAPQTVQVQARLRDLPIFDLDPGLVWEGR